MYYSKVQSMARRLRGQFTEWTTSTFAPTDGPSFTSTHSSTLLTGGRCRSSPMGVGTLDKHGILQLRENVTLKSNSPAHAWVNSIQVWGIGTANLATGEVRVKGYKA